MGEALLKGWVDQDCLKHCIVVDPTPSPDNQVHQDNIHFVKSQEGIEPDFTPDVIVFAIKPQVMEDILPAYQKFKSDSTVFLSIAAGKTVHALGSYIGHDAKIIRAMPNTPAAIGQGTTVFYANDHVTDTEKSSVTHLLSAVGIVCNITDESLMDAVTAVSGSGPAYVFLMIETLTKAAINAGLPEELSTKIARQTIIGSAGLAADQSNISAKQLRENVTSPGGTTAAALEILMHDQALQSLFDKAIINASQRSKELS